MFGLTKSTSVITIAITGLSLLSGCGTSGGSSSTPHHTTTAASSHSNPTANARFIPAKSLGGRPAAGTWINPHILTDPKVTYQNIQSINEGAGSVLNPGQVPVYRTETPLGDAWLMQAGIQLRPGQRYNNISLDLGARQGDYLHAAAIASSQPIGDGGKGALLDFTVSCSAKPGLYAVSTGDKNPTPSYAEEVHGYIMVSGKLMPSCSHG